MPLPQNPCYNCFVERHSAEGPCPNCGYDHSENAAKYPLALSAGGILDGRYIVGRVLGQGGFGITYLAYDYQLGVKAAIKEFMPDGLATRLPGTAAVTVYSGEKRDNFAYGSERFLDEARVLAKFLGHPNIVGVKSYFDENDTSYFVMDYIEGVSFKNYIQNNGGKVGCEDALRVLAPVLSALSAVHGEGFIHRDVSPDNIYLTKDGGVKLLDFGSARYSLGDKSKSLDVILKAGYAPKEQYTRRGKQGPWTDVYSVAACFYASITGYLPPDSLERMEEDELVEISTRGIKIPAHIEDAIMKGLEVRAEDRYQSAAEFLAAVQGVETPAVTAPGMTAPVSYTPTPSVTSPVSHTPTPGVTTAVSYTPAPVSQTPAAPPVALAKDAPPKRESWLKRNKLVAGIVGGAVVAIAGIAIVGTMSGKPDSSTFSGSQAAPNAPVAEAALPTLSPAPTPKPTPTPAPRGNTNANLRSGGYVAQEDGWIYYLDFYDIKLYKSRPDGSEKTKLNDAIFPFSINVLDGWVYYASAKSDEYGVYKIRTDGSEQTRLSEKTCSNVNVVGDWIYFNDESDGFALYRMGLDGENVAKLTDEMSFSVSIADDWIYYYGWDGEKDLAEFSGLADDLSTITFVDGKVYKMRLDGSEKEMLFEDRLGTIYVEDEWIYYSDDAFEIFRMREDGSEKAKLDDGAGIYNVSGEWVYYRTKDDTRNMYKMRLDGTDKTRLNYDFSYSAHIFGEDVYYMNDTIADGPASALCQMKSDGTQNRILTSNPNEQGNMVANVWGIGLAAQKGGWVYFRNTDDNRALYKIRTDGTGETKLSDDIPTFINVVGDWVYYTINGQGPIYRIRADGTDKQTICKDECHFVLVVGEWVYYLNGSDGDRLYRIRTDGDTNSKAAVSKGESWSYFIEGDSVYYCNLADNDALMKTARFGSGTVELGNNGAVKLGNNRAEYIQSDGEWIYYRNLNKSAHLYKMKLDGTSPTLIAKEKTSELNVVGDSIYFISSADKRIYRIGKDGESKTLISEDPVTRMNFTDDWIYCTYVDEDEKWTYFKVSVEGGESEPFHPVAAK